VTIWFAEDVWATGISPAYNEEGNRQVIPIIRETCRADNLEVHTIYCPGDLYLDRKTGTSCHLSMVIQPMDIDKVLVFLPGVDSATYDWLRKKGYKICEVDLEEQVNYSPTCFVLLEPGVIFMNKESVNTIKKVRAIGVEVIEVPNAEFSHVGGNLRCRT